MRGDCRESVWIVRGYFNMITSLEEKKRWKLNPGHIYGKVQGHDHRASPNGHVDQQWNPHLE